jgi:hypothetical protein
MARVTTGSIGKSLSAPENRNLAFDQGAAEFGDDAGGGLKIGGGNILHY